ncbi:MAG: D-tyrosyl-tRNA(Tyr) deacylase [Granulosicoccus sp.]|nr:D-tyrosyl-tRNA(Tyr) deacylase [Granulosicoccus sp.]
MIALLQRVTEASVSIDGKLTAEIGQGLLALIGVEKGDTALSCAALLDKLLAYRMFSDVKGRMNLNLQQVAGGLLLVPQFTLVADTSSGLRPGFSAGAAPADASALFNLMVTQATERHAPVGAGVFAADMQVGLVNDGPVTFWLRVEPA